MKIELQMDESKKPLMDLLQNEGVYFFTHCSGNGTCGKCKVRFLTEASEIHQEEENLFTSEQLKDGWRLACKAEVSGQVQIEIPGLEEEGLLVEDGIYEEKIIQDEGTNENIETSLEDRNLDGAKQYLVAFDIGTTTLVAAKLDSSTGSIIGTAACVNSQRTYGSDVISRIKASNEGKAELLRTLVMEDIANLLSKLKVPMAESKIVVSCNTTMGHILQGFSCETLGAAPYIPVDISYHEYENMTMLPGISTFVGADIVSGIIACGMDQKETISLLIDVGTNGEMAIGNKHRILVTSAAAGPAFEGGNISHGVASIPGAIWAVRIIGGFPIVETIGLKEPSGICGSGVLEVVYELLKNGMIDETGLLCEPFFYSGYPLTEEIIFTAKDVREVQYAKSAIRTGIEILIREYGISYDQIEKVYLAGGFGKHINIGKAVGIGLLPKEFREKVTAVGNSSLTGAVMAGCKGTRIKERMNYISEEAQEILLADHPAFQNLYLKHLYFPER